MMGPLASNALSWSSARALPASLAEQHAASLRDKLTKMGGATAARPILSLEHGFPGLLPKPTLNEWVVAAHMATTVAEEE